MPEGPACDKSSAHGGDMLGSFGRRLFRSSEDSARAFCSVLELSKFSRLQEGFAFYKSSKYSSSWVEGAKSTAEKTSLLHGYNPVCLNSLTAIVPVWHVK